MTQPVNLPPAGAPQPASKPKVPPPGKNTTSDQRFVQGDYDEAHTEQEAPEPGCFSPVLDWIGDGFEWIALKLFGSSGGAAEAQQKEGEQKKEAPLAVKAPVKQKKAIPTPQVEKRKETNISLATAKQILQLHEQLTPKEFAEALIHEKVELRDGKGEAVLYQGKPLILRNSTAQMAWKNLQNKMDNKEAVLEAVEEFGWIYDILPVNHPLIHDQDVIDAAEAQKKQYLAERKSETI
jgi:hypothetical protein